MESKRDERVLIQRAMFKDKLHFNPASTTLGAEVLGPRIPDYTSEDLSCVKQGFLDHAVLIFPNQYLTATEQMSFAEHFGDLVIKHLEFSNVDDNGCLRSEDDPLMRLFRGNEDWHTDSSFQMLAAKVSMLTAIEVPSTGGETEWADMRHAYQTLGLTMKEKIKNLCAYHSLYRSQANLGEGDDSTSAGLAILHQNDPISPPGTNQYQSGGYGQSGEAPLRKLVKVHPETGTPNLYIGRHAYDIPGLSRVEATTLLEELLAHACQPQRVLTHKWRKGDLVMWDNRCVLHRARPWPLDQARVMHHTRVNGEMESESAENSKRYSTV